MGIFSKLISTDKITKKIVKYFNTSYDTLLDGLQEILKEDIGISKNQYKELMIIPMIAITKAILGAFGDSQISKDLQNKFQKKVFNNFKNNKERDNFSKLFWNRINEYSEIIQPDNKNLDIKFGQIFYQHFFEKGPESTDLVIMTFIGSTFLIQFNEASKFLDEVRRNYTLI